jgi:hypothetical protein
MLGGGGGYSGGNGSSPRGNSKYMNGTGGGGRGGLRDDTNPDDRRDGGSGVILIKTGKVISIGTDSSGNGNDFQETGLTPDSIVADSPTNNWCTWDPLKFNGLTLSNGNLTANASSGGQEVTATLLPIGGQWYFEFKWTTGSGLEQFGVTRQEATIGSTYGVGVNYRSDGIAYIEAASTVPYGDTWGVGDIIGCAYDLDTSTITFYKNNVSQGEVNFTPGYAMTPMVRMGDNGHKIDINFGQRTFAYTPPEGFLAINSQNMEN